MLPEYATYVHAETYELISGTALFEAFHQPFPDYNPIHTEQYVNLQGIAKLPAELYELILAQLSPSSLDAARYTCRRWQAMIMNSSHILESVTKQKTTLTRGGLSHNEWLRSLQRLLDFQADLVRGHDEPEAWRTRYRQSEIDFLISPMCSHPHVNYSLPPSYFTSARLCVAGSPIACLVTELQAPKLGKPKHMVLYHIGSTQRPHYIGSIPFYAQDDTPRIMSLSVDSKCCGWTLAVEIDGSPSYYSISTASGFSSGDSPFALTAISKPETGQESRISRTYPSTKARITSEHPLLERLEPLPNSEVSMSGTTAELFSKTQNPQVSNVVSLEESVTAPTQYYLAKHRESELLHVIHVKNIICTSERRASDDGQQPPRARLHGGSEGEQEVMSIACLSPPNSDCVYKNVTIAPSVAPDEAAQIAVIWQDNSIHPRRSELYLYDAFPLFAQDNEESEALGRASKQVSSGAFNFSYRGEEGITQCTHIQAKRIRSLNPSSGGVHPSSPLWQRLQSSPASKSSLERQAALGGLQMLQSNDKMHLTQTSQAITVCPYRAIHVWGPTTTHQITLSVFDISYAGPSLRTLTKRLLRPEPHRTLAKMDPDLMSALSYTALPCQCALHDDGYQVLLPDVRCAALGPAKDGYQLGRGKEHRPEPAMGQIMNFDTPARVEALERKDEWLRERIRYLKRKGMGEGAILSAWWTLPWTKFGALEKPWRWQEMEG